ncbi:MAG TPA: divalent metal cation transporter, partial [Chloroflexota bacterium]|nr:divalent metal cation transporter [Chloroflexota bacterium]
NISSAADAAAALTPLAGSAAHFLFGIGFIGMGLLAIPVLSASAAYAMSEAFGWEVGLNRSFRRVPHFYGIMAAATAVGLALNFTSINPIDALLYTAIINGVIAPILLVVIMLIANNPRIMLDRLNGFWSNLFGWITTVVMGAAAIALFLTLGH